MSYNPFARARHPWTIQAEECFAVDVRVCEEEFVATIEGGQFVGFYGTLVSLPNTLSCGRWHKPIVDFESPTCTLPLNMPTKVCAPLFPDTEPMSRWAGNSLDMFVVCAV